MAQDDHLQMVNRAQVVQPIGSSSHSISPVAATRSASPTRRTIGMNISSLSPFGEPFEALFRRSPMPEHIVVRCFSCQGPQCCIGSLERKTVGVLLSTAKQHGDDPQTPSVSTSERESLWTQRWAQQILPLLCIAIEVYLQDLQDTARFNSGCTWS